MATTNYALSNHFQQTYPHSFNALQKLVMAMAKVHNDRGKRTFFGRDKGLEALKNFEARLRDTLLSMVLDEVIARNAKSSQCREKLVKLITLWAGIFPNWQDAYSYADEYFVRSANEAEDRITELMR